MPDQMNSAKFLQRAFLSIALLLSASCSSTRQEYYALRAAESASVYRAGGISVGIGRISLPSYIDRAELVFQSGKNQFEVPTNARWVGALPDNIAHVLADDLRRILHVVDAPIYPWPPEASPRYVVIADIQQFHGISGSDAILEVSWRIEASGKIIVRRYSTLREPIVGDGYAAVVEAESELLARFAETIARLFPEH
jgi:uncharacterized lipoprotein YmbA